MFCSNCGAQITGHGKFCTSCGAMVSAELVEGKPSPQNVYGRIVPPRTVVQQLNEAQQLSKDFRKSWRGVSGSVVYLIFVICFTLTQFLNYTVLDEAMAPLYSASSFLGLFSSTKASEIQSTMDLIKFFIILPGALMALGYWLIYADSHRTGDDSIQTGGLSLIRGVLITILILLIVCEIFAICGLISTVEKYESYVSTNVHGNITSLMVVGIFVFSIVEVVLAVYISALLKMKQTAESYEPDGLGMVGVAGTLSIIFGVLFVWILLNTGLTLAGVLNCAGPILLGVVLHMYKNAMENAAVQRRAYYTKLNWAAQAASGQGDATTTIPQPQGDGFVPNWKHVEQEEKAAEQAAEIKCPECDTEQSADNKTSENCIAELTKQ